jgi:hypothetical protein
MTESVGNNENLNDFGTIVIKTHFRLSALTELTGEFDVYHQRVIFVIRDDQAGLFKLVTLDRILNRITGVTSGCWWLVVVNNIPVSDICQINQQNISSCSVINNRIKKFS